MSVSQYISTYFQSKPPSVRNCLHSIRAICPTLAHVKALLPLNS